MGDKHFETLFRQRKHKTFNYKPRFIKSDEVDSENEDSKKVDFVSKWRATQSTKRRFKGGMKLRTLILVLVLLLICMYLLESKIN